MLPKPSHLLVCAANAWHRSHYTLQFDHHQVVMLAESPHAVTGVGTLSEEMVDCVVAIGQVATQGRPCNFSLVLLPLPEVSIQLKSEGPCALISPMWLL